MAELVVILASVTAVSLVSFIGVLFVGMKEAFIRRILMVLVGFSSGSLIGAAFINLLPEALEEMGPSIFYYVIIGIVFFFAMEKFLYWRHCHDGKCPVHMFAYLNLIGDGIHNFVDGVTIAASFIVSYPSYSLGFAATLAVVFHEIPQELGDFGVLLYGGFEKRKALTYNFLSALTAIAGSLITYYLAFHIQGLVHLLVPIAAGGFIYIAATDLMPELHKRTQGKESLIQLLTILAGIALMSTLKILFPQA